MASCKDCICEQVCKYNDGVNLWCKGDCPRFKDRPRFMEIKDCTQCKHFTKHAEQYPCSRCRSLYKDKYEQKERENNVQLHNKV